MAGNTLVSGACKLFPHQLLPLSKLCVGEEISLKTDIDLDRDVARGRDDRDIHLGENTNQKVLNQLCCLSSDSLLSSMPMVPKFGKFLFSFLNCKPDWKSLYPKCSRHRWCSWEFK